MDRKVLAAMGAVVGLLAGCPEPGGETERADAATGPCCPAGEGSLAGPLAFQPRYVRSSRGSTADGGVDLSLRSVSLATAGACTGEGTTGTLFNVSVSLMRPGREALEPGTYPVTGPDYTWPNDGGQGGPHGETCLVLLSSFSWDGGSWNLRAAQGSVTLSTLEADLVTGTLDVVLDPADGGAIQPLSGSFTAPLCTRGAAAAMPRP